MKTILQNTLITIFLFNASILECTEPLATIKGEGIYAEVNSPALKAIIDSGVPVIILDARPSLTKGDKRIPRAIPLRPTASPEQIASVIPSKNSLIVTYCEDLKCADDADLSTYLISLGYKNVIEFSTGLHAWMSHNYPVEDVN
jgi:rhodanese-related sulfurtransferase